MEWDRESFQRRLLSARERCGLNQQELGAAISRGKSAISQYEKGTNIPTISQVCALAAKLKITPAALAFGDDFTPMDDEEKLAIGHWRKMTKPERDGFLEAMKGVTENRSETKKAGKRTTAFQEFVEQLRDLKTIRALQHGISKLILAERYEQEYGHFLTALSKQLDQLAVLHELSSALPDPESKNSDAKNESNNGRSELPADNRHRNSHTNQSSKAPPSAS